mmetsp:Transcript_12465/g.17937  ORF Transcript_12465/g.17937 Transcript_12465/m.17937 type:complete len:180 (-) Transcript_12465:107-646(-)
MTFLKKRLSSITLLASAFVLAAISCTFASNFGCGFIDVKVLASGLDFSRGLWRGQFGPGYICQKYNKKYYTIDTEWKTARAMSVLACILAGLALVALVAAIFDLVRSSAKKIFKYLSVISLLACLFEGLTLLFFKTQLCSNALQGLLYTCELDSYSKLAISATGLWFLGASGFLFEAYN